MGWTCRNLPSFPFVCRGPSVAGCGETWRAVFIARVDEAMPGFYMSAFGIPAKRG
jgi:hypothetical protein